MNIRMIRISKMENMTVLFRLMIVFLAWIGFLAMICIIGIAVEEIIYRLIQRKRKRKK